MFVAEDDTFYVKDGYGHHEADIISGEDVFWRERIYLIKFSEDLVNF